MIVGFDISTKSTGYCAGTGACSPETDAWKYEQVEDDLGLLLWLFDHDLTKLFDRVSPTHVLVEAPIMMTRDKLLTVRKLYSMSAYLELFCRRRGVVCREETVFALKKRLTGSVKADKTEMVRMAKQKLRIALPKGAGERDAADAVAAWLIGLDYYAPQHQPSWDKLLYGARGSML